MRRGRGASLKALTLRESRILGVLGRTIGKEGDCGLEVWQMRTRCLFIWLELKEEKEVKEGWVQGAGLITSSGRCELSFFFGWGGDPRSVGWG